jgi:Mannosyltransferase putative/Glycosyltransferase family 9 (heptosyltransferase)
MKKLILECGLAPGDIVMLTAAVRDLHYWYPRQFVTDVRTRCGDLWENNPYITPVPDDDPEAKRIDCSYPLINRCNYTPYHCLHGFIEFLNEKFHLNIKPTVFRGDIHLSKQERIWYSQVHEVTGQDTPFWIVAAGGKYDVTIKWWDSRRFQEVIDHFRGKIQFVQVGHQGHHHPKLNGAIDLRGRTSLRELIRLVYHSQGVLCPVTSLMHLAAAVPTKGREFPHRPCVVVAGGREPAHWEAYPGHQLIHTNGALPCSASGGCWKDRTQRLRDGDPRDRADNLCVDVANGLPRCMDLITSDEVIRRIKFYFEGGTLKYLLPSQAAVAESGVRATAKNRYDSQALNLHSAGMACEEFIKTISPYPETFEGRGIVICAGGVRYFTNAWVCINRLRQAGCAMPIEVWYLDDSEMDEEMQHLLLGLGVKCVNAREVGGKRPARINGGWELKPYALLHSRFREVLFLDADNVVVVNPELLFETREYRATGAIFWPDYERGRNMKAMPIWRSCGLGQPKETEFETGQIVVDKQRCWAALCLSLWFNENSDFYYQYLYGDKETFHLAFRKLRTKYSLVPKKIHTLEGTMCQHDFLGRRIFQHRNTDKWDLLMRNRRVKDFWFEEDCLQHVKQLRELWDGRLRHALNGESIMLRRRASKRKPTIQVVMISLVERLRFRDRTLESLARTKWEAPIDVHIENGETDDKARRYLRGAYVALKRSLRLKTDYVLLLKDALDINQHLWHNLLSWQPYNARTVRIGSLYNPNVSELACDVRTNTRVVTASAAAGSEALLISKEGVECLLRRWHQMENLQNFELRHIAKCIKSPVFYHAPSLVQPLAANKGQKLRPAIDFDPIWKA